jgi:hypothetical protein
MAAHSETPWPWSTVNNDALIKYKSMVRILFSSI